MADPRDALVASLFHATSTDLTRLAYLIVGDWALAEEVVQEAFLRVWRSRRRLRDQDAAPAYVRRTVVNVSRSRIRRIVLERRARPPLTPAEPDEPAARLDLAAAVAGLPQRKRACVVLRYYADLTESETADLLGISVGTVKSQTSKALRALAAELGEADPLPRVVPREDGAR